MSIQALSTLVSPLEKTSADVQFSHLLPDREYALVMLTAEGSHRLLRCDTPTHIKQSMRLVQTTPLRLPEDVMSSVRAKLAHRAHALAMEVPEGWVPAEKDLPPVEARWDDSYAPPRKESSARTPEAPVLSAVKVAGLRTEIQFRAATDVQDALTVLSHHFSKLSSADRLNFWDGIAAAAQALGVKLTHPAYLSKMSGDVRRLANLTVQNPFLPEMLQERSRRATALAVSAVEKTAAQRYAELATSLRGAELSREELVKVAEVIDLTDKALGLRDPVDPEEVVLTRADGPIQAYNEADWESYDLGTIRVLKRHVEALRKIPLGGLTPHLGVKIVERLKDDPLPTFESLDLDQQRAVAIFTDQMITQRGRDRQQPGVYS